MYIDFDKISQNARIWVYQTNHQLADNEIVAIENYLKPAVNQWAAHGASLLVSAKVLHNRFVIIALDQDMNEASGCSIDASTRWFKELGEALNVDFSTVRKPILMVIKLSEHYVKTSKKLNPCNVLNEIFIN